MLPEWSEPSCINCGATRLQQPCSEHFYSKEEQQDNLIAELLERIDTLERGNRPASDVRSPSRQQKMPKNKSRRKGGTPL